MKVRQLTPEQALMRLESLCARAEHCTAELKAKLARWGISATDASAIIDSLQKRRFVDDSRFASAFINDKLQFAKWGRRKIAVALSAKGIPRAIYGPMLEDVDMEAYSATLLSLLRQKASGMEDSDTYEGRTRLFRFAASRGYELSLITSLIPKI